MIHEVFDFLKNSLNTYLESKDNNQPGKVGYLPGDSAETLKFPSGQVTLMLLSMEEEKKFRQDNRYLRVDGDGAKYTAPPVIQLNLFLMFVSRFGTYQESLKGLDAVVRYFQANPVFLAEQYPALPDGVPELKMELHTPAFSTQNEIWSMLKTPYQPSAIYYLKMVCIEEDLPIIPSVPVREWDTSIRKK